MGMGASNVIIGITLIYRGVISEGCPLEPNGLIPSLTDASFPRSLALTLSVRHLIQTLPILSRLPTKRTRTAGILCLLTPTSRAPLRCQAHKSTSGARCKYPSAGGLLQYANRQLVGNNITAGVAHVFLSLGPACTLISRQA